MDLLTIGAFARASRLSAKALRRYDELGLLPPAHVDPVTGYRFYAPEQLDRARLVAWLRRLGMPLAEVRVVCELDPAAAAAAVEAFWAIQEQDVALRRDLAATVVAHLTGAAGAEAAPPLPEGGLTIDYAAASDTGLVRPTNQDSAYAGERLLAVADGFGPGGAPASRAAIETLTGLVADGGLPAGDLLNVLQDAVAEVNRRLGDTPGDPDGGASGTTLTAMLWTGARLALVHVGDSRAYLLRDGALFQITHDHTWVQAMVDDGRLTAEEAGSHPRRAMLLRALDGRGAPAPDLRLHDARPGDRYLLCSDGLSAVVPAAAVRAVLTGGGTPEEAVRALVAAAHEAGGPDNVSCVVADVRSR